MCVFLPRFRQVQVDVRALACFLRLGMTLKDFELKFVSSNVAHLWFSIAGSDKLRQKMLQRSRAFGTLGDCISYLYTYIYIYTILYTHTSSTFTCSRLVDTYVLCTLSLSLPLCRAWLLA